jgi:hypothetical protein
MFSPPRAGPAALNCLLENRRRGNILPLAASVRFNFKTPSLLYSPFLLQQHHYLFLSTRFFAPSIGQPFSAFSPAEPFPSVFF